MFRLFCSLFGGVFFFFPFNGHVGVRGYQGIRHDSRPTNNSRAPISIFIDMAISQGVKLFGWAFADN